MTEETITAWNDAVAVHDRAKTAMRALSPQADDAEAARLSDAESAAWGVMMRTPVPDNAALVVKIRALFDAHADYAWDEVDNPDFLTRLLDENDWSGGFPIVRLLQDAMRLAGQDSPILNVCRSIDKPWPVLTEAYQAALAARDAAGASDSSVADAHEGRLELIYWAVIRYPVTTAAQMAEKAALIAQDCRDPLTAFHALQRDAGRLAGASA